MLSRLGGSAVLFMHHYTFYLVFLFFRFSLLMKFDTFFLVNNLFPFPFGLYITQTSVVDASEIKIIR